MSVRIIRTKYNSDTDDNSYSSEMPTIHLIERHSTENQTESDESTETEEKPTAIGAGLILNAVYILFALVTVTILTNLQAPKYAEDFFYSAIAFLQTAYPEVYATNGRISEPEEFYPLPNPEPEVTEPSVNQTNIVTDDEQKSKIEMSLLTSEKAQPEQQLPMQVFEETPSDYGILRRDLSVSADKIHLTNETNLDPDMQKMAFSPLPISIREESGKPLVLILHTHGTECYADSENGEVRTTDRTRNVVRIGEELAKVLEFHGIPTIHSKTMHDEASYITAYNSSRAEAAKILQEHPTIKYVIDLHRDAVPNEGARRVKPCVEINGEQTAQVMLVIGTNAGGGNHPNYTSNLTVAAHLQEEMNTVYPTLARPINLRRAIFNQNLSPGSILLEVGSDGNTIDEAIRAVQMFGRCFAAVVK